MALDANDLALIRSMEGNMTPYEQFKTQHMQSKSQTGGVAITGLVTGVVGTALAVGAWIFGPMYGNAKARQAREAAQSAKDIANVQYTAALQLMNQQNQNTNTALDRLISTVATERAERIAGDVTLTNTVNDSVSGSQQGSLTAQQQSELSAIANASNTLLTQAMLGNISENAQKVQIYSAPQPCGCPGCGCQG